MRKTTRMEITHARPQDIKWLDGYIKKNGLKDRGHWLSHVREILTKHEQIIIL